MRTTKERAERTRTRTRKRRSRRRALLPRASARQAPRATSAERQTPAWRSHLPSYRLRVAPRTAACGTPTIASKGCLAQQHKLAPGEPDFNAKGCACWLTRRGAPVQAEGAPSTSKPKKEPAKKKSRGGDEDDEDVSHRSAARRLLWVACCGWHAEQCRAALVLCPSRPLQVTALHQAVSNRKLVTRASLPARPDWEQWCCARMRQAMRSALCLWMP